ncbi:hypothetical protein GIB67_010275 [Kingdonia uniflora]|uniref:Uncharacterized protein n=1 Tax=Kingdonia uniflora TaxID=39325 RepID=A0A7J7NAY1_9MAGN|nr:hypothetical protein GIB67_010275 [Kingdonia uniflora]
MKVRDSYLKGKMGVRFNWWRRESPCKEGVEMEADLDEERCRWPLHWGVERAVVLDFTWITLFFHSRRKLIHIQGIKLKNITNYKFNCNAGHLRTLVKLDLHMVGNAYNLSAIGGFEIFYRLINRLLHSYSCRFHCTCTSRTLISVQREQYAHGDNVSSLQVITKLLYLLNKGETFTKADNAALIFATANLFEYNNIGLRRMVYLMISELSPSSNVVRIVARSTSTSEEDPNVIFWHSHQMLSVVHGRSPWDETPYVDAAERTAPEGLSIDGFLSKVKVPSLVLCELILFMARRHFLRQFPSIYFE